MAIPPPRACGICASRRTPAVRRIASSRVSKSFVTSRPYPEAPSTMRSTIRIAAAADVHAGPDDGPRLREAFACLPEAKGDLVLLAGDLTQLGKMNEAQVLADVCRELP